MTKAYGFATADGKFKELNVKVPEPQAGEVTIRHTAVGINFFDYSYVRGSNNVTDFGDFPAVLGSEGCGIIEAVGTGVKGFQVGDKVAYATGVYGAFAERRTMSTEWLLKVPQYEGLTDAIVAGTLYKGLLARTLAFRVVSSQLLADTSILVYSAAGGIGHLLTQYLAQNTDIKVYGAVGTEGKKDFAKKNGCAEVVNYTQADVFEFIREVTQENGVAVVYDSVGEEVFKTAITCMGYFGTYVSYGNSSQPIQEFDLNWLYNRCLNINVPRLDLYLSNRAEYILSSETLWLDISEKRIKPMVTPMSLDELPKAMETYRNRNNIGCMVVTFN